MHPWHEAAEAGNLEKLRALLKDNPDLVFSKDGHGWTPLHHAAEEGYKGPMELLLAHKAEVNARTNNGETPLHLAAYWAYKDLVKLLLAGRP